MSLKTLQKNFINTIFAGNEDSIKHELMTDKISAKGLMDIYRNNASGGTLIAMSLTYPACEKIVGERFFNATCKEFFRHNRLKSCNLDDYGGEFAEFLENFTPAQGLPYLPDVARLEWAFHKSGIAEKGNMLDQETIAKIPQEKYFNLRFSLHPSAQFVSSKYAIHEIWKMAQDDNDKTLNLDEAGSAELMLIRQNKKVDIIELTPAELVFLKVLKEGKSFYEAFDEAGKKEEEFDLAFYLNKHIVQGTFSGFLLG